MPGFSQFLKTDHMRPEQVCDAEGRGGYCPQPPGAARTAGEGQAAASAGGGNVSDGPGMETANE